MLRLSPMYQVYADRAPGIVYGLSRRSEVGCGRWPSSRPRPDAIFKAHLGCDGLYRHPMTGVRRGISYECEFSSSYNPQTASRCHLIG